MKRNLALVRAILEAVEATPAYHKISLARTDHAALAEYEQTEIDAHAELLADGELLRVTFTPQIGRPSIHAVRGLTWQGHDYLDQTRSGLAITWER